MVFSSGRARNALPCSLAILLSFITEGYSGTTAIDKCGCGNKNVIQVQGVGPFNHYVKWTFENGLPSGLVATNYVINDMSTNTNAKYNHQFTPDNVQVAGGFLTLVVPGGQTQSPIQCGEVATSVSDILYASVRVQAILSTEPGVVNGAFFYHDSCQEMDIEYISDPNSGVNAGQDPPSLQYTNEATSCDPTKASSLQGPAPTDVGDNPHSYRIDWVAGETRFYTDGVEQAVQDSNVATVGGRWKFNLWSNGDPGFSVGPPQNDAYMLIQSITMYYNRSSDATSCVCTQTPSNAPSKGTSSSPSYNYYGKNKYKSCKGHGNHRYC